MAAQERRAGLGRGLSALLGDEDEAYVAAPLPHGYRTVAIGAVHPGRQQPRKHMDDTALQELAESIREKGILQPLIVRQHPEDRAAYELIAGERRWRAAQLAQLHEIPVVIKELSDGEAMEIALIENLQRQDLSPVEEAEGYRRLMEEFSHTQKDMARVIGKSRSHVANTLRLLALPESVKALLEDGVITAGHARALLTATAPEQLAEQVVRDGLNVRQTEKLAQAANPESRAKRTEVDKSSNEEKKDSDTLSLERDVSNLLGLKVQIYFSRGGGKLSLYYDSLDQLDEILNRLSHGQHGSRKPIVSVSADPAEAHNSVVENAPDLTALVGELANSEHAGLVDSEETGAQLPAEEGDGEAEFFGDDEGGRS